MDDRPSPSLHDDTGSRPTEADVGVAQPFGDWLVRVTRPGFEELKDSITTNRARIVRPFPDRKL
jgi:hypothetical protein